MKCWICGGMADSGEHRIKASDLRDLFGRVSPDRPLYYHDEQQRNRLVKGLKANILKSSARLCVKCNNERTQPFDRAWERLSKSLRRRRFHLEIGERIKLQKVFPGHVEKSMLAVHLYFAKVFGCQIAEHHVPIDLSEFSDAILKCRPHPKLHLALCPPVDNVGVSAGGSEITASQLGERVMYAVWFYILDRLTVRVMFAEVGEKRRGLVDSWHPSENKKIIRVSRN